jgi:hypothetical protein
MISDYFEKLGKKFLKKPAAKRGAAAATPAKGKKASADSAVTLTLKSFKEEIERIIPAQLNVDSLKPINGSGFSPEGADLLVYYPYCRDIALMMNGYMPVELIYGSYFLAPTLNKGNLHEVLNRVVNVKKINQYSEESDNEQMMVPAFVVVGATDYPLRELKNDVLNYYMSRSIIHEWEFDILIVINKGLVIKNWREKRSFIALETGSDTFKWFFILMNEYLDHKKEEEIDFRDYVNQNIQYNQY